MNLRSALAVLLTVASAATQAAGPQDYAVNLPIETRGDSAAWQFELGIAAYAWTQDAALGDVQVFNADGRPVPMQMWKAPASIDRVNAQRADLTAIALPTTPASPTIGDLRLLVERDAQGRLRRIETGDATSTSPAPSRDWLLDVAAFEQGVDLITLNWSTPDNGVIARFAIDASNDLQAWRTLRDDASIVLLQQDAARVERRDIRLDATRTNYLRLRRLDAGADLVGLRIGAVHEQREAGAREPLQWTTADTAATLGSEPGKRFDYALPATLPIEAVRIELANDNALAQLSLSATQSAGTPTSAATELTRVVVYRLRQGDALIDNGDIVLGRAARARGVRIDSATPLMQPPRLQVGWRGERVVFLAEGRGPWVLAVGHLRERRADTQLTAAIAALRAQSGPDWQPPLATLGAPREAAGRIALQPEPAPTPWRRWLLWAVLAAGAGLVATIALNLLRGQR